MGPTEDRHSVREIRDWIKRKISARHHTDWENVSQTSKKKKKSTESAPSGLPVHIENSFYEHALNRDRLADLYPLSRINVHKPQKSLGLNQDEALNRLGIDGRNSVCYRDRRSNILLFLKQFLNTFRFLLLITAVLCATIFLLDTSRTTHLWLSAVLFSVLLAMIMLSYWQEKQALKQTRGFTSMIAPSCDVIRGGGNRKIDAEAVVVGDIVWIRPGNRVPADIRLLWTHELKLETSWISGEVEPLEFYHEESAKDVSVLQAQNIAFNGCQCISGDGIGVVIRTGNNTVIGQLVAISAKENKRESRLSVDHARFVRFIAALSISMSTVTFFVGMTIARVSNLLSVFVNGFLIVMVANVPQGLPVTLTAQLVIVARRLAKTNLLLKKLDVSETLGTASVLLCDKTGVLTENDVKVTDIWFDGEGRTVVSLHSKGHAHKDRPPIETFPRPVNRILQTMAICNRAHITMGGRDQLRRTSSPNQTVWTTQATKIDFADNAVIADNNYKTTNLEMMKMHHPVVSGAPLEKALLMFVEELTSSSHIRANWEIVFEIPFNKCRRSHVVIVRETADRYAEEDEDIRFHMFIKGAPEELIAKCSLYETNYGEKDVNNDIICEFKEAYLNYARQGRSCIGLAYATFDAPADTQFSISLINFPQDGFTFLGMAALYDPPRVDVKQNLRRAKRAKIKIYMVTGDHPSTAAAIADQCGFGDQKYPHEEQSSSCVILGSMLDTLTSEEWDTLSTLPNIVFARTNPEQKLKIVEELMKRGECVCVTGDGVMDAPVLKKADLGIAVDAVGSVFAKEAADIVIDDGNVKNIIDGVEHGRLLFENLKKTIAYTLAHLTPELIPVILTFAAGWPLALSTMQILTIDLITELPPSISLIYEGAERDLMRKPPRKPKSHLVSKALLLYSYIFTGLIIATGCLAAYLSVFWYYGVHPGELFHSIEKHWYGGAEKIFTDSGLLYDGKNQQKIRMQASAAYQVTLVGSQIIHLFNCRTRRASIFRHTTCNMHSILAVLIALILLNIFVYVPGINHITGTAPPPSFVWFYPLATGFVLTVFNEIRKYFIRNRPDHSIVRVFKW